MALVCEASEGRREKIESDVNFENEDCIDDSVEVELRGFTSTPDVHGRGMSSLWDLDQPHARRQANRQRNHQANLLSAVPIDAKSRSETWNRHESGLEG